MAAAGIVVFRRNKGAIEVLGLIAPKKEQKRGKGIFDVPKGTIEKNEDVLKAAKRECFEESGLKPVLTNGPFSHENLTLWIGEVDCKVQVKIQPNPITGEVEHLGYVWNSPEYIRKNCLSYLHNHLIWAEKILSS